MREGAIEVATSEETLSPTIDVASASSAVGALAGKSGALELSLYEKIGLGNGRYANNPWLQELPDPVSRVVWDNYLVISPKFAHDQQIYSSLGNAAELDTKVPLVNVKAGSTSVDLPVFVIPGQPDNVVSIALGYGRTKAAVQEMTLVRMYIPC